MELGKYCSEEMIYKEIMEAFSCSDLITANVLKYKKTENCGHKRKTSTNIPAYTIGHYNHSVRIINLVSHTTHIVFVNFYTQLTGPTV